MNYGGVTFKHVWDFQIKIMMGSQYKRCVQATSKNDIILACMRLGWNDAFRHTSKNIDGIKETEKEDIIVSICKSVMGNFIHYAELTTTKERHDYINECLRNEDFISAFGKIKNVEIGSEKALCFGHIQKMFNMAIKLFLCLKICVEQAKDMKIDIGLEASLFDCDFAFESADCPIDSIILANDKLSISSKSKWSKLGQNKDNPTEDYITIQSTISNVQGGNGSNLLFDFENWN